ncbi:Nif3-like dinuclear metal center hexameric protein [Candidatus Beckwithbacteria bacterium RBG_13_42_9]|uniref:Nif3-like dinuclear metal center hexameric protein n=1 Tax=Candidatus Beckwithbacteria bacterium RBG_13_42_9 TaxID=1797457 RepID=A0A1F5E8W5_9BACT|nr:MAG: Nif3-like dinuclear metal center hexameric protein [Candidatus Beckwithbacteria bacterium RBG_13_42_9]
MVNRDNLIAFINKTLGLEQDKDPYLFNGLQVVGKDEVKKIALGVTDNLELFTKAGKWGADVIIVHHGLLGPKKNMPITRVLKNRLKVLFDHDINLLCYHLYLDKDPVLGNNAQIIKLLGAKKGKDFGQESNLNWGFEAEFNPLIDANKLEIKLKKLCGSSVVGFKYGPKLIKKIGVVSGGGPYCLTEAIEKKLDAFLTGEPREWIKEWAKEAGIHFFYLGHYNSEVFGVKALGEFIKKKYPQLQIKFIDIPNTI